MPCPFCEIAECNPPGSPLGNTVFYSTDRVLAFLDIQPLVSAAAHVLIVPRAHYATMDQLSIDPETASALGIALAVISKELKTELGAVAFNVIQNNGTAAGQVVDHVHFHIIIRKQIKTINPTVESEYETSHLSPHNVMERILKSSQNQSVYTLDFKTRASYSALVFGRGHREDLDDQWANSIVPKLRSRLPSSNVKL